MKIPILFFILQLKRQLFILIIDFLIFEMPEAAECLRIKLVLSILSGKPMKLKNIRRDEVEPGLNGNEKILS